MTDSSTTPFTAILGDTIRIWALPALVALAACGSSGAAPLDGDSGAAQLDDGGSESAVDAGLPDAVIPWSEAAPSLVPIAGRNVEVVEGGVRGATVVFESGLGSDWTPWEPVAREVSERARVFAYSRPGYGASDPTAEPRTATRIVSELRALLRARGLQPPFVLVGHSFGGTYMELFAKAHPEEVAGLVLVDPRHRDFSSACEAAGLDGCTIPASVVASLPQVEREELQDFASTSAEIRDAGAFGSYPVRVLTATVHGFGPQAEALWESMHGSLADEAEDGEQTLFTGAGHGLQIERAHEVAEAILKLVPDASL